MTRRASPVPHSAQNLLPLFLILAWLALVGWGVAAGRLPWPTLLAALLLNLVTFLMYWLDKNAAQRGRWRTRESTLHLLSLSGGWPGAWCAQQRLRHKTRKPSFRTGYWFTVILHFVLLASWVFSLSIQARLLKP